MLRTAIVGYGSVARSHVTDLRFFSQDNPLRRSDDPLIDLVACCDVNHAALERFAADTGVTALYHDLEEMLREQHPDFVCIATCADAHLEPVLTAAAHGVHVLCEKPLATECSDCDRMIEACEQANVQFVVSHQRRSDPVHWYARQLLQEGLIGHLRYIHGGAKSRRGGEQLHNIGSHLIDAIGIFGGEIDWVAAYCSTEGRPCTIEDREPGDRGAGWVLGERVDAWLGYKSGVQAMLQFNEDPGGFHWVLWGTQGRLAVFGADLWHCKQCEAGPGEEWERVPMPSIQVPTNTGFVNPADWPAITEKLGPYSRVAMIRELAYRLQHGGEHTSSGKVGAVPIETMQATFVSHLTGCRAKLPLPDRRSPLSG
jgi:predicted dehydrogenase